MKQSSIEWLEERLTVSLGDDIKSLRGFFVIAKEMHKEEMIEFAKDYGEFSHLDYIVEEGYDKRFNTKEK